MLIRKNSIGISTYTLLHAKIDFTNHMGEIILEVVKAKMRSRITDGDYLPIYKESGGERVTRDKECKLGVTDFGLLHSFCLCV